MFAVALGHTQVYVIEGQNALLCDHGCDRSQRKSKHSLSPCETVLPLAKHPGKERRRKRGGVLVRNVVFTLHVSK
jgi:hypothetical protein